MDPIEHLLTRGVDSIYPSREALEKLLRTGKKLTLYQGFDPSGPKLHIGHAVALRKLRQFQNLGHKVIFLIGDFTGLIGDPTGKAQGRKVMTREEVSANAKEYKEQASKILRFAGDNPVELKFNSHWLSELRFEDILKLAAHFSVQQLLERDMFQERIKRGDQIGLHEFFYPLMQGYDSVAMGVDLELGGTDQTFNMLAGRKLVSQILHKEKFVMTVPLLTDARGVKIGKTEGNVIGITDKPVDFFGKIMNLGDDAILPCLTLLTDMPKSDIDKIKNEIRKGTNPMKFKKQLAYMLTSQFHSDNDAKKAQEAFERVFQRKQTPTQNASVFETKQVQWNPVELLTATGLAESKSGAKRLVSQKAIELGSKSVETPTEMLTLTDNIVLRVGKRTFVKIRLIS